MKLILIFLISLLNIEVQAEETAALAQAESVDATTAAALDYQKEYDSFCEELREKAGLKEVTNELLKQKKATLVNTPCGSLAKEEADKVMDLFRNDVGRFCQRLSGQMAELDSKVQLDHSCVLGSVKLQGSHHLKSTIVVGTKTQEPLNIQLPEDQKEKIITWRPGLYFGYGTLQVDKEVLQPSDGYFGGISYSQEIEDGPSKISAAPWAFDLNALKISLTDSPKPVRGTGKPVRRKSGLGQ